MEGSTRESWETQREENRACGALRHFCDGDFMGKSFFYSSIALILTSQ
jgi:hypothetical protein